MKINKNTNIELNNGIEIPQIGLGTYLMESNEVFDAVKAAIDNGYTHIDTASVYGNEQEIGDALNKIAIKREDLFITTKVWNDEQGYDKTLAAFDYSLKRLDMDYVDLYLIHWPVPEKREETWKALQEIYKAGRAKSIGVSNYTVRHIEELMQESSIAPAVNQVEMSPFLYQKELIDTCKKYDIEIEAYSPLTRKKKFNDPVLKKIAEEKGKTPAQILIRWSLQKDFIVLPKSATPSRIKENIDVYDFELNENEMAELDNLNEGFRVAWNPENIE